MNDNEPTVKHELLTCNEAAAFLRVSRKTLWWLTFQAEEAMRIPLIRIGKRAVRYRRTDLNRWLDSRVNAEIQN